MRSELESRTVLTAVEAMVRKRVPASDVDDVVQAALADAVASKDAPADPEAFRRWLAGVVRHKVADFHRKHRREVPVDVVPDAGEVPAHEERDLLRWAEGELPSDDAKQTLEWMMHEADGEKLEAIAERERMPATRVRQRVSRLRAFFRERWHRELVLAALVAVLVVLGWVIVRAVLAPPPMANPNTPNELKPDLVPVPPSPRDLAPPESRPALDTAPLPSAAPLAPPPVTAPDPSIAPPGKWRGMASDPSPGKPAPTALPTTASSGVKHKPSAPKKPAFDNISGP